MTDLAEFLRDRYAERRAAEMRKRRAVPSAFDDHTIEFRSGDRCVYVDGHPYDMDAYEAVATKPAPDAFVLADLDSKLAIVDEFAPVPREPETDAELHARFRHPAWEYETTEGQRKQWDHQDTPPEGDGWERNLEAGRDGWERFDYTEESYWRRPRAEPRVEETEEPFILCLLSAPFAAHPDYKEGWRP